MSGNAVCLQIGLDLSWLFLSLVFLRECFSLITRKGGYILNHVIYGYLSIGSFENVIDLFVRKY
jgi:hypothetical protein